MPVSTNNEQHLRKWLMGCPEIVKQNRFHVDYLSDNPTEYALFAQPSTIAYTENVLGERVPKPRQVVNFVFATKDVYGADERQNLANYEGMCLGPKQDGSRQCIILVADSQNRAGNAFYHLKDCVKALDFRP